MAKISALAGSPVAMASMISAAVAAVRSSSRGSDQGVTAASSSQRVVRTISKTSPRNTIVMLSDRARSARSARRRNACSNAWAERKWTPAVRSLMCRSLMKAIMIDLHET